MAWETRGNRRYYYRKKRVSGRVVSEYIGTGAIADLTASTQEQTTRQSKFARKLDHDQQRQQAAIDTEIKQCESELHKLLAPVLVAAGYHRHKRQWRKKLARNRLVREHSDPQLAAAFDEARDCTTTGLDLASGQMTVGRRLQAVFTETDICTDVRQSAITALEYLAILGSGWLQHD